MSHHTNKTFSNAATTPVLVAVIACSNLEGIVVDIHAAGGTLGFTDDQRAESQRMHDWIRSTFIGQSHSFFVAHNGVVPHHRARPKPPEINIVNKIDFNPEALREAMRGTPGILERILRRDFTKGRTQTTKGAASDPKEARSVVVGHPGYELAPKPDTYWQDRNRILRFFRVISTHECEGHSHIRMQRVDNQRGGEYEFAFTTVEAWEKMFSPTTADKVPGLLPYQQAALDFLNVSYKPARELRMPRELGMGYGLDAFFQELLDGVEFTGKELPPAVGERYHSFISGQTYTVVDVRPKHESTDLYVTMDRDGDGHRAKFTYQGHAKWLTVWRPLDHEDKPRRVAMVDLEMRLDTSGASEALRALGEQAHEAALSMSEFNATDALGRIFDELHKRLPGWNNKPTTAPLLSEAELAIRAIRTLVRVAGRKENDALKEQNKAQLAMIEVKNKEIAKLKQERGGSWGPDRIRTEQDRMREMVYEYARLFRIIHGTDRLKVHMQAFGVSTMRDLPPEVYVEFMRDCRTYAEKCMP